MWSKRCARVYARRTVLWYTHRQSKAAETPKTRLMEQRRSNLTDGFLSLVSYGWALMTLHNGGMRVELRPIESTTKAKESSMRRPQAYVLTVLVGAVIAVSSCTSDDSSTTVTTIATEEIGSTTAEAVGTTPSAGAASTFRIEVWADNWMAVYVNGELIGEDSVSITTERSFNVETFTFEATYPFSIGIEAKAFMETSSGIEYIGENNQQMGDGGLIAQVTDLSTSKIVAATSAEWTALVVQRAPLNTECERDADPDATCEFEQTDTPTDWADAGYDDSGWGSATEWTANDVGPNDGYNEITWDSAAQLIWGSDLEVDNIILFRQNVSS